MIRQLMESGIIYKYIIYVSANKVKVSEAKYLWNFLKYKFFIVYLKNNLYLINCTVINIKPKN